DIENDLLKEDAPYSERVEVLTGDISGLLSEDLDEQQAAMNEIQTLFPELNNTSVVDEIINKVGATSNIQVNNTQECIAHEYSGYNFDIILHGESQTKTKTQSITDGTKTFELTATCNNGVVTYGEEQISISCEGGKVEQNGSCVSDICQGTLPTNAQLNGTQGVSGTWGYNQTEGLCNFICNEGYNYDNGTSCELNTYTVSGNLTNGDGATVNVCGANVTAGPTGAFSTTINHGTECDNISVIRSGYSCTISTQGPSSLAANVTNIAGNCSAIVNGSCGTANGVAVVTSPTSNLCSAGNASTVTTNTGTYTWSCNGINTGTDTSCTASRKFTVTFNGNGGTAGTTSTTVNYNTTIGTLPTGTKTGYTLDGWYTQASGGTKITTATVITADTTYYAQWTINTYTVSGSFGGNANGATINVCGTNVTAATDGTFAATRNHGSVCNNITATRTGYTCSTTTNGPASLTANVINITGTCGGTWDCKYFYDGTKPESTFYFYLYSITANLNYVNRGGSKIFLSGGPILNTGSTFTNGLNEYMVGDLKLSLTVLGSTGYYYQICRRPK
ncbi:MAG: InlB B-repeat-containing protein, partial [Candidatus Absconditabacteria bacterium]